MSVDRLSGVWGFWNLSLSFRYMFFFIIRIGGSSRGVVDNVLDCDIVVSEFELQSRYDVHFRSNIIKKISNLLISQDVD